MVRRGRLKKGDVAAPRSTPRRLTTRRRSIKDRSGSTQTRVDDLNHRFDLHLAANARAQASMWSAIVAIAKSSPPEEEQ